MRCSRAPQILEELNCEKLYKAYSHTGRKPAVDPKILFKVLTYAYANNIYSSRKIETACKRDINFMWLLKGRKAPDHSTIVRFRDDIKKTLDYLEETRVKEQIEFVHGRGRIFNYLSEYY